MKKSQLNQECEKNALILNKIIQLMPKINEFHSPTHDLYALLKHICDQEVISLFRDDTNNVNFATFGKISFPYVEMGKINSINLFNFDEIIIFSFYYNNRNLYKSIIDIGGNIGLHSIMAGKLGFNVITYEPDELHFKILSSNISENNLNNKVKLFRSAVSNSNGTALFTRVLDNTTGSHLTSSKKDPYGPLEEITVKKEDILDIIQENKLDLMKIDAEGHECEILERIPFEHWDSCDAIVEVGTSKNAEIIFNLYKNSNVKLFSQKISWKQVKDLDDMPCSHKDGSLFISIKENMPWGETSID